MELVDWLNKVCDQDAPDQSIVAFNFGLFETAEGYAIYLIGSKTFDINDSDWTCNHDYEPADKYYYLNSSDNKKTNWQEVLEKTIFTLTEFSKSSKFKNSFFNTALAITTGFDDGDLVRIV